MSESTCVNCGKPIYQTGSIDYRGRPWWVHRNNRRRECELHAIPKEEE